MAISHTLFQPSPYKSFSDFENIKPLAENTSEQFTATEKNPSRPNDACYEEKWYLLLRQGLFRAQVEKAISEIYKVILGYATDIEIVKKQNEYYSASRGIAHYIAWFDALSKLSLTSENTLIIENEGNRYPIFGLGFISALTDFFDDNDSAPGNFGLQFQANKKSYRAFKIDSEKALEFVDNEPDQDNDSDEIHEKESLEAEIKNDSEIFLKMDVTATEWFKQEKQEMLERIAITDFSIIEKILRKHITSTKLDISYWLLNHSDDVEMKKMITLRINQLKPEDYKKYVLDVDSIVEKLREKHNKLCIALNKNTLVS